MPNSISQSLDPWPDYYPLYQSGFNGGINVAVEPNRIDDSEYVFLSNARTRDGVISAIKSPLFSLDTPKHKKFQALETIDKYLILIAGGQAYYKDLTTSGNFKQISPFSLDKDVDIIYTQLVPESTLKNLRAADDTDPSLPGRLLASQTSGTPGALVCQDGIKRPRAILSDGSARQIADYNAWSLTNREYVPIGKQMAFVDGILYVISPDGKSIFRSVTGRPLDFVVAIDNDGNKVSDAKGTSHAVDFNTITGISVVSGNQDSNIAVGSKESTHLLVLNFDRTLYGEPTFNNPYLFPTGPVNNFSFLNTTKDTVIVDAKGLRSFNATRQLTVESNSDIFSKPVYKFFGTERNPVIQDIVATGEIDNYALFAVNTIYGYGILVFDTQTDKFVSFDQYAGVGKIKKFSTTKVNGVHRLFFITTDDKLYEAFAGENVETAKLYPKEISTANPKIALTLKTLRLQFNNLNVNDGIVSAKVISDRKSLTAIEQNINGITEPGQPFPLNSSNKESSSSITFEFDDNPTGYSLGVFIQWQFEGELVSIALETQYQRDYIPSPESANRFSNVNRSS